MSQFLMIEEILLTIGASDVSVKEKHGGRLQVEFTTYGVPMKIEISTKAKSRDEIIRALSAAFEERAA